MDVIARLQRAPFTPRALPTLSPEDAAAALDHWDPGPYLERPLDEVRAELGISPRAA